MVTQNTSIEVPIQETFSPSVLNEIESLYDKSQLLTIWNRFLKYADLSALIGPQSLSWASRVVSCLGGKRLSWMLSKRACRLYPNHPGVASAMAYTLLERRGPLSAIKYLSSLTIKDREESPEDMRYLWGAYVTTLSEFRDFDNAQKYFNKIKDGGKDVCWQNVLESWLFEKQDRYEAALESAKRAVELNPASRSAVQQTSHLLQLFGKNKEALEILQNASQTTENGPIVSQLVLLQIELKDYAGAQESINRYLSYSPLADSWSLKWANNQRIRIACHTKDYATALNLCSGQKESFYEGLSNRLKKPEVQWKFKCLPVGFVRQHHLTCAPATVTALARYWNVNINHLELSEEICYDGTPSHSTRRWVTEQGLVAIEFKVTWESAVSLIDRGIPFAITTMETTTAHMQAVIGYDELRQALLIRDPFFYTTGEAICPKFLERYASSGPQGLVMLPQNEAHRLADIVLEETALYTKLHQLDNALHFHRRDEACKIYSDMRQKDPEHRLSINAGWAIAVYDSNSIQGLNHIEVLLKHYPTNDFLTLTKYRYMLELTTREERLSFLTRKITEKNPHPVFYHHLAQELMADARQLKEAAKYAAKYLRYNPTDGDGLSTLGNVEWDTGNFQGAVKLYRLAACSAERREYYSMTYFKAANCLRLSEEALDHLYLRFKKLSSQSAQPAITLFNALCLLNRDKQGFEVLHEAETLRSNDGELSIFMADAYARRNEMSRAEQYLTSAEGRCKNTQLWRTSATIAAYRADQARALSFWQRILELEPLAMDAHRESAWLLAQTEGFDAATLHLNNACLRFPQNFTLSRLKIDFMLRFQEPLAEAAMEQHIRVHTTDTFAMRELALTLTRKGNFEQAFKYANDAIALEPNNSFNISTRAEIYIRRGDLNSAQADLESAICKSIENGYAIKTLISICQTHDKRTHAIKFLQAELKKQIVFDDALFAFRDAVWGILSPEELLAQLEEAHAARLDLWATGVALSIQLKEMGRLDESLSLIAKTAERFPLVPRIWLEKASILQMQCQLDSAVTALEQALALNPQYTYAIHELADVHAKRGNYDKAERILKTGISHNPLAHTLHYHLGDTLWKLGQKNEAIRSVQLAIRLNPDFDRGWEYLHDWGNLMGNANLAIETARDLASKNPKNFKAWIVLAENLLPCRNAEALEAVNKAIQINPWADLAFDLRARIFANMNQMDDAISSCHPAHYTYLPVTLRLREAWLEAQRGKISDAILKLNNVLAEHPSNYSGWRLLAEWHFALKDTENAEKATTRLLDLAPQDPQTLQFAGNIALESNHVDQAKDLFARAFRIAPNNSSAGMNYFDILFNHTEYEEAAQVLKTLKKHDQSDFVLVRELQYVLKIGPQPKSFQLFRDICRFPATSEWPLNKAAELLISSHQDKFVSETVEACLQDNSPNIYLGSLWVTLRFEKKVYSPGILFEKIAHRAQTGELAVKKYIHLLANKLNDPQKGMWTSMRVKSFFRHILKKHRESLRQNDYVWGSVGYAFIILEDFESAAEWLADWRSRKNAEPWMLYNLALALEILDRPTESLPPLREALNFRQDASSFISIATLLAFEEAMCNEVRSAKLLHQQIVSEQLSSSDKPLYGFTKALLLAYESYAVDRRSLKKQLKYELKYALGGFATHQHTTMVRKSYLRCIHKLGIISGFTSFKLHYILKTSWDKGLKYVVYFPLLFLGPVGWILILFLSDRTK